MTYFFDNTFPKKAAEILRLLGVDIVHLQDEFPADTPDEIWIPVVAGKGYLLITGDGRIRRGSVERQALEQSKIPALFIYSGYTSRPMFQQVSWIIEHWETIAGKLSKLKPGEIRHVNVNGIVSSYEEIAAKRKRKR